MDEPAPARSAPAPDAANSPDFRSLFESVPALYLVLSPEFRIVGATDEYLRATMTERGDILGRLLFEVFPDNPNDPGATGSRNLRASLQRVLETRRPDTMAVQKYDIRRPASEGGGFEERHWSPVNSPILGPGGSVEYILHRVEDVTEFIQLKNARAEQTRQTEQMKTRAQEMEAEVFRRAQQVQDANTELRTAKAEAEALLATHQAVLASTLDPVVIIDSSGVIQSVSASIERFFQWKPTELIGQNVKKLMPESYRSAHTAGLASYQRTNISNVVGRTVEVEGLRKDGATFPMELSVSRVDVPGQVAPLFTGIIRDLTERKRSEQAAQKLVSIVEESEDAIISEDFSGTVTSWNRGAEALFGYAAPEIIGRSLSILVPPDREREPTEVLERFRRGERVLRMETVRLAKDGRRVDVSLTLSPIKDARGNTVGISKIARDITDRKHAHAELEKAKSAAESANRAKSDFLAHMSHEIRTPLNGVLGLLDLLMGTPLNERQQRYAQLARASGDTLTTTINDVLDFSKIESGKLEVVPTDLDLHEMVEDAMEMLAQKAAAKGLELACRIDPDVPALVRGDGDRLRQVLINLVNNAIKFTERGAVVLHLSLQQPATVSSATVRFTVTDTGIGISPDRVDRLFKAFSQADVSTTRIYGGTGLGLAIAKQLAELMGGEIGVESEPGCGSTFWFTAVFEVRAQPPSRTNGARVDLRTLRVLAVDDNDVQREILRQQIASWGLAAAVAPSAADALDLLTGAAAAATPFRVAIVDSDMPGMNGFELAAEIKARADIRETVLMILLSVEADIESSRLRSMGFAGHMTKPVRQSQLFNTIMQAIADSGQIPETPLPSAHVLPNRRPNRESGAAASRGAVRVLLAEDNEINQIVATEILNKTGYACEVVANGEQAVAALRRGHFDMVLMDCQMPILDGFEATRAIRRLEQSGELPDGAGSRVPIVALTANAMKGDREECIRAGMDGYVTKPIDAGKLVETIESLLSRAVPAQPADQQPRPSSSSPALPEAMMPGRLPPALDLDLLLERCTRNAGAAQKLLDLFEKELRDDIEGIDRSVLAGDASGVARTLHALKGAAGVMAAHRLFEVASELEVFAREADLEKASAGMHRLREEARRCRESLPEVRRAVASLAVQPVRPG
jgi:ammonium transporter, Amt family